MSRDIQLEQIHPNPTQPRKHFAGIEELAESIRDKGVLAPILVRPVAGAFEIVHGERRWRAAKLAGLATIAADVREMSDAEAFTAALVENVQRADLTAIEEAAALQRLLAGGMTQAGVGRLIGKGQSYVAHKLRLLDAPEPIRVLCAMGGLSEGHVRQLLRFEKLVHPKAIFGPLTKAVEAVDCQDVEGLCAFWNLARVEDQPPLGLWMCVSRKAIAEIARHPKVGALKASFNALLEYVAGHSLTAPQWIVNGWWYGSAAIVHNLSVADLAQQIDFWAQRYRHALEYCAIFPKCPSGKGDDLGDRQWWAARSDLRHGGSSRIERNDAIAHCRKAMFGVRGVVDEGAWVLPTSMQQWFNFKAEKTHHPIVEASA